MVMKIGIIGAGVVGGTLIKWLDVFTDHRLLIYDPLKEHFDDLTGCDAIFISVPVPSSMYGQDLKVLTDAVVKAKQITDNVFIRSTVLPGTNDSYGTIAMPEFLTERRAYEDMVKLPMIFGNVNKKLVDNIFPFKEKIILSNIEAEIAKYTHNCFGAFKVTYFNMIKKYCDVRNADYEKVKLAANITGFLGQEHLSCPGPDGRKGYGGKCFPVNMDSMESHLRILNDHKVLKYDFSKEVELFSLIRKLNQQYRNSED